MENDYTPSEIAVGQQIRKAYKHRKEVLLGKRYKPNQRHVNPTFWHRAGRQCLALEAEPEDYVAAAFEQCRLKTGPFPNNMFGAAARQWYLSYRRNLVPDTPTVTSNEEGAPQVLELPVDHELDLDLQITFDNLANNIGTRDPSHPKARDLYRLWSGCVPPHLKVIFGFGDPVVLERHRDAALEYFTLRPNYVKALERRGYDLKKVMAWLTNGNP